MIALDLVVAERFRFLCGEELPVDFAEWQRASKHILKITRAAQDLKPEDEQFITDMDNGCWGQQAFDHWCLGEDLCPAKCGGRPETALPKMQSAVRLSVDKPTTTPLTARWEGVDAFTAKLYRARRQHDVWLETHRRVWP